MTKFQTASAAGVLAIAAGWTMVLAQTPTAEVMSLGLRGVYFVENQGQWSDASVEYGFKTRGLDIAFRESSFTMHLSREVSRNVPVEVAVDPTDGAWASRPYEAGAWASRPYERSIAPEASPTRERGVPDEGAWASRPYEAGAWASRPYERSIAPEASLARERGVPFPDDADPLPHGRGSSSEAVDYEHLTLTVTFPGSNPATPRGADPQAARFNYYIGDDESRWASNVPSFGAIIYENLYDGVDLHICGNDDGVLKYEFHVAPGADWNQIRIAYDGIDSLCVDDSGDLRIKTSFGTLMDSAPMVWQEDAGSTSLIDSTSRAREEAELDVVREVPLPDSRGSSDPTIPARFELVDATTYRFALEGPIDPTRTLIIDPDVEWMVYLGGSSSESGVDIAVDSAGNALLTGLTTSTDFAGRNNSHRGGDYDAFALRISPSGKLQWMTYLGGSRSDSGRGIAVDGTGSAVMTGETSSVDFAGRNNSAYGGSDAFALKVSSSGSLLWMTYLGGSSGDVGSGIALDVAGNCVVTGETVSANFAGASNSYFGGNGDAFALKMSSEGQLQWMTYLGGSNRDVGDGITVDSADNALVGGWSDSSDFAGRNNSYHGGLLDAFVLKISPAAQLQWMTYLGGSSTDYGRHIAVDGTGSALMAGETLSVDFAGRNNSYYGRYQDAFALKVSASGELRWMTYLGGSESDHGYGIAVDTAGNPLVTGYTWSTDFAGRNNSHHGGYVDAFAVGVGTAGELHFMSYLGGSDDDVGGAIAVDHRGNAVVTGSTYSTDFAGRNNSYQGDRDTFLVKLRIADGPQLAVAATCPSGGPIRIEWSGATANGPVALIFARCQGDLLVRAGYPCQGTQLGLCGSQVQVAWEGRSDANGGRILNAFAGNGACGGYLQLLDLSTCATSNVARIE